MGITSRGFITFDPTLDGTKTGADYITKDSKENMELLDTQLTTLEETITNKVKLNNESLSNVNFIRNDLVGEGYKNLISSTQTNVTQEDNFMFVFEIDYISMNVNATLVSNAILNASGSGIRIYISSSNKLRVQYGKDLTYTDLSNITVLNGKHIIKFYKKNGLINVDFDGIISILDNTKVVGNLNKFNVATEGFTSQNRMNICLASIKPLTPNEIQHNFSILNNTPSINRINDYALSTDTDHIQDRTGRTTEQINRVFYKNMCKEFTSDGSPISVNNGMEGYVLSAKLEGQTVKQVISDAQPFEIICNNSELSKRYNLIVTTEIGKTYTLVTSVKKNTLNSTVVIGTNSFDNSYAIIIPSGTTGLIKTKLVCTSPIKYVQYYKSVITGELEVEYVALLEGDWSNQNIPINCNLAGGLHSTQATITNNGLKYSFYKDATDKASGTIITLGGVGIVGDTLEIKEDGSGVYTKNFMSKKALSTDTWVQSSVNTDDVYLGVYNLNLKEPAYLNTSLYMSNRLQNLEHTNWTSGTKKEFFTVYDASVNIKVLKSSLQTPDIEGLKKWLDSNEFIFYYRLATPIITTIPRELMPTILTQLQNEFKFGDTVAPYKATIQAPVNKMADLETRIAQLEKVITSTSNLSILGNYAEDEYNKAINQL